MIGARCNHEDGFTDHPGGTSGPSSSNNLFPGTPGASKANPISRIPMITSLLYVAASGVQNRSGAILSHNPVNAVAHGAHRLKGFTDSRLKMHTSKPQATSLMTIA